MKQKAEKEYVITGIFGYAFIITILVWYFAGIALVKGFWATFFAVFSPYGLYVVVEKILQYYHFVN